VFRDPGDDDPGNTHCASRPAAPSTLRRSSRPPTAASARQPSRAAHATPIACAGARLSLRSGPACPICYEPRDSEETLTA
jgi:hypothetical protein